MPNRSSAIWYHGVHLDYVKLCQLRKISVVLVMPGCIGHAVMAIRARCDIRAEEQDYSTNSFRMAAYHQYILWRCDGVYMAFKRTLCTLHFLKYYYLCITNQKFATKMIFVTILLKLYFLILQVLHFAPL
jgi:hypothetical protein